MTPLSDDIQKVFRALEAGLMGIKIAINQGGACATELSEEELPLIESVLSQRTAILERVRELEGVSKNKLAKARDPVTGQYAYEGDFERLCRCGHRLGDHIAGGFECLKCEPPCGKFKERKTNG